MNAKNKKNMLLPAAFALLSLLGGAAQAADTTPVDAGVLSLERGSQKVVRDTGPIRRVAIGDPAVADVNIVNRSEVMVTGKAVGSTSLIIWPEKSGARPRQFNVRVGAPSVLAQRNDAELSRAQIESGRSLQGVLPNLLAHRRAKIAANNGAKEAVSDVSGVELSNQVLTEVKIAEVSRSTLQQFGFNLSGKAGNNVGGIWGPGNLTGATRGTDGVTFTTSNVPLQNAFNIVLGSVTHNWLGALSVLERKGLARVLAEPSLLATSGQTANYLAGGEFPIPVSQGISGSVTIDYKEFGVRLSLSPTVLSRDRISLKVSPEVSDLDFTAGVQISGVAVPALTVRRTDTTVELGDGESFVISGLISHNVLNNVDKVPGLGDIPVLGAFFRSSRISREDKELVMVVTPHLVRPIARGATLPPLPGAKFDNYDPNFAQTMLLENGDYTTGFSR